MLILLCITFLFLFFFTAQPLAAQSGQVPAFPTAEGYGKFSQGGRGGQVLFVSNLNDSGAGSLRACATASGPRTCVFTVGGTINLSSRIDIGNPYLTIAGQTAPGGIQIKMNSSSAGDPILITTHNVILRYLTIRPGTLGANARALSISAGSSAVRPNSAHDVIADHLSTSWSEDEQIIVWYDSYNVTLQNNLIAEGLTSGVQKGPNMGGGGGGSIGGPYSFYGNIVAFFYQRMPRIRVSKPQEDIIDIVNNLIYNPTWNGNFNGAYLSDAGRVNLLGNYLKVPSGSVPYYLYIETGQVHAKGNIAPGRPSDTGNEQQGVVSGSIVSAPFVPASGARPVSTVRSPTQAYDYALSDAGNSAGLDCSGQFVSRRDSLDTRIITDIRNGTGALKTSAGPWPVYTGGAACPDTDSDGMSDTWETAKFQNLSATATADADNDGYTNLEEYLNATDPAGGGTLPTATPPTAPTATPGTLTPSPTGPASCPNKQYGDADCDGQIKLADNNIWRAEYFGERATKLADYNADTRVSLEDFEVWRRNYQAAINATPTP